MPPRPKAAKGNPVLAAALASPLEEVEQAQLFAWAELAKGRHPELDEMFAVPNFAGHLGGKVARLREGGKAKKMGRKAGVEDVLLLVARGGYHGLCIEMKRRDGTPSDISGWQADWHAAHARRGYKVAVCYGWEHARAVLEWYLGLGVTRVVYPAELPAEPPRRAA